MPQVTGHDNRFLTDDMIVKEALRLLKNNLVMAPLVYREYESKFAKKGDTINLELPYRTKSASGRQLVKQPLVDQSIPLKVDNQEHFGIEVNTTDRTLSLQAFSERYLQSGVCQIANVIDRSLLLTLKTAFFSSNVGNSLTAKKFLQAQAEQAEVGVPQDGMCRGVMNYSDAVDVSDDISTKFNENMVKQSLQKGYLGPLASYELFRSANMPTHTVGNYGGTPKVKGADQTGTTIDTDGWNSSVTGLLNAGDVVTFGGVKEINPQSYASTGRLQAFVVQEDVDSDGSGNATIKISPSLNDGTLTTTDGEGNTVSLAAYQNVTSAPADNATVSVLGSANTEYRQNYLFHREAIALCMIDLELPQSAPIKSRVRDPDSGLSMSMTGQYDINNQSEITRIDAVWADKLVYPELAHRLWGPSV